MRNGDFNRELVMKMGQVGMELHQTTESLVTEEKERSENLHISDWCPQFGPRSAIQIQYFMTDF